MVRHEDIASVSDALASAMMSVWNTVDGDVIHVRQAQALIVEQSTHGLLAHHVFQGQRRVIAQVSARPSGWGPTVMLLSIETLFLDGRHNLTVDHQRSTVVLTGRYSETENDQALRPFPRAEKWMPAS